MLKCYEMARDYTHERRGSAAVEFALVGMPFILFVIGIIEISLMFAAGSLLEGSVYDAARVIRTGQAQSSGDPEQTFKNALCNHASVLLDCDKFEYQVKVLDNFDDANSEQAQVDADGNLQNPEFDAGGVSSIVMVRVLYPYQLMTPGFGKIFGSTSGGRRLLMATTVFETEPYQFQ